MWALITVHYLVYRSTYPQEAFSLQNSLEMWSCVVPIQLHIKTCKQMINFEQKYWYILNPIISQLLFTSVLDSWVNYILFQLCDIIASCLDPGVFVCVCVCVLTHTHAHRKFK